MYVEGGMQAGLVIRSPGLHQELRGRHLADFWVTGNVRAQLPNVLGIRRRHALTSLLRKITIIAGKSLYSGAVLVQSSVVGRSSVNMQTPIPTVRLRTKVDKYHAESA